MGPVLYFCVGSVFYKYLFPVCGTSFLVFIIVYKSWCLMGKYLWFILISPFSTDLVSIFLWRLEAYPCKKLLRVLKSFQGWSFGMADWAGMKAWFCHLVRLSWVVHPLYSCLRCFYGSHLIWFPHTDLF